MLCIPVSARGVLTAMATLTTSHALFAWRRFSIHANQKTGEAKNVMQKMPIPIDGCPDIYHCGFSSAASFGSTAYLIVREEGNILVDSPRFHPQLLTQLKVLSPTGATQKSVAASSRCGTAEPVVCHPPRLQHLPVPVQQSQGCNEWESRSFSTLCMFTTFTWRNLASRSHCRPSRGQPGMIPGFSLVDAAMHSLFISPFSSSSLSSDRHAHQQQLSICISCTA